MIGRDAASQILTELTKSDSLSPCALVRPGKVIAGLEPAPVGKRLKDKGFARSVNRDDVYRAPRR